MSELLIDCCTYYNANDHASVYKGNCDTLSKVLHEKLWKNVSTKHGN